MEAIFITLCENSQISRDAGTGQQNLAHLNNGILFSYKKE